MQKNSFLGILEVAYIHSIKRTLPVLPYLWGTTTKYQRKSAYILNTIVDKINKARKVKFSLNETATQKLFSPPFSISLHFDLNSLCCSHNVPPIFKCPETNACAQSCA
jgi:hypothetical protein